LVRKVIATVDEKEVTAKEARKEIVKVLRDLKDFSYIIEVRRGGMRRIEVLERRPTE